MPVSVGSVLRYLLRILFPRGAAWGIAVYAGLCVWSLVTREGFSAFGVKDDSIEKLVFGRFFSVVVWTQLQILAAYLAVGWVSGTIAGLVLRWAPRGFGREEPARWYVRGGVLVLLILAVHFILLGRTIAEYPPLFTESLYDQGGWRASLQTFLTRLPLWVFDALLVGLVVGSLGAIVRGLWRTGRLTASRRSFEALPLSRRRLVLGGAAVLVVVLAGWRLWPVRATDDGPNVLLIAVDSLRADRLSSYGYPRQTPAMDQLGAQGAVFERAHVSLPRTFPSWTTLLTGEWPHRHGIRHMFPTREERDRMPKTIVHAFAQKGYQTSIVGDYAADIFPRADYGFQRVSAPYFNFPTLIGLRSFELHKQLLPYVTNRLGRRIFPVLQEMAQNADARELGDRTIDELRTLASKGKFFLTVFFSAVHFPYSAPSPYYRLYTEPSYAGVSKYHKLHQLGRGEKLGAADVQQIQDLYDGAVKSVDDQVARILAALDDLGATKNTVVVLFSDHGEHLHEAGLGMGHGEHFRGDAVTHVPLMVRGPGIPAGQRVKALVRDVDLAPTLSALTKVEPLAPVDGVSLLPLARGETQDLGLELYGETGLWFVDDGEDFFQKQRIPYPALTGLGKIDKELEVVMHEKYADLVLVAKHRVVQTATHKLIYIPTRQGVVYELYDLVADPQQRKDVAREQPDIVAKLKVRLFRWMQSAPGVELRREYALPATPPPKTVAQEAPRPAKGG